MKTGRTSKDCAVALTLAVIYLPCWLLPFLAEDWNLSRLKIWPFLAGIAIRAVIPPSIPDTWLPGGFKGGFFFTVLLLGTLRLRRAFGPMMAGLLVFSFGLVWVILALNESVNQAWWSARASDAPPPAVIL